MSKYVKDDLIENIDSKQLGKVVKDLPRSGRVEVRYFSIRNLVRAKPEEIRKLRSNPVID